MTRRRKLLAVGPAGPSTGFGRVFRSILGPLSRSLDVTLFSPNLVAELVDAPYRVVPRRLPGDIFGREAMPAMLAELDPDLVVLCHDPPFWSVHRDAIRAHQRRTGGRPFCAFYCPIEWDDLHPELIRGMADLDALVLYSQFGLGVVKRAFAADPASAPRLHVIPHGLDRSAFHPLPGDARREARRRLFPDRPELHDTFIVLNANRNCARKRIERSIEGFGRFVREHPEAYLYLHMGTTDSGCDVLGLAAKLGILDRVLLTHRESRHPCVSNEQLNVIYNACDVGLNTSTGEGWGLVAFEHAATGAPQIVPDHSACREHWADRGILLPDRNGDVAVADIATALELLCVDLALRRALSSAGRAYAEQARFDWEAIACEWLAVFERAAGTARPGDRDPAVA